MEERTEEGKEGRNPRSERTSDWLHACLFNGPSAEVAHGSDPVCWVIFGHVTLGRCELLVLLVTASNRSANVMQCTAKYQGASSMHCSVTITLRRCLGGGERSTPGAFSTNLPLKYYLYDSELAGFDGQSLKCTPMDILNTPATSVRAPRRCCC